MGNSLRPPRALATDNCQCNLDESDHELELGLCGGGDSRSQPGLDGRGTHPAEVGGVLGLNDSVPESMGSATTAG